MSWIRYRRFLTCKAQLNVVAAFLILIIVLLITVPFLLYYVNFVSTTSAISMVSNDYKHLKDLQVSQVEVGSPSILYTGSFLIVQYSNSTYGSTNFTVTGILYLNKSGVWKNVTTLKYPIVVTGFTIIPLPSSAQNRPIIVVTSLGNLFFLTPNSGIGAAQSRSGTTNGFGVTILAQVMINQGQQIIPITTNLVVSNVTGTPTTYSTPVLLNYAPAYFYVQVPLKTEIPGIGAVTFRNWVVIGNAKYSISTGTSYSTIYINMLGSSVAVIANYTHP